MRVSSSSSNEARSRATKLTKTKVSLEGPRKAAIVLLGARLCGEGEDDGGDEQDGSSDENDGQCGPHFGPKECYDYSVDRSRGDGEKELGAARS